MRLAVLWRLHYKLRFRDVAEPLLQRRCEVTHETVRNREFQFTPVHADRLRTKRRGSAGVSWYIAETYVNVAGRKPLRVTTDHHPAYHKAIRSILGRKVLHRRSQYLKNLTEQDHRVVKQRSYPMLGLGRIESAARFCVAFDELRQYFRVRQRGGKYVPLAEKRRLFGTR